MMDKGLDVNKRAREIHEALSETTRRFNTTAVGLSDDGRIIVGSNEVRLRPEQRNVLQRGEIEAIGPGHAEETVLNTDRT